MFTQIMKRNALKIVFCKSFIIKNIFGLINVFSKFILGKNIKM